MGLLDPIFKFITGVLEGVETVTETITNPDLDGQQFSEIAGQTLANVSAADEVAAAVIDLLEEFVLEDLQDAGAITPENVEGVADQTEGGATAVLFGLGLASSALEAASLGQIDEHQEYIAQAIAGLGITEVTGLELDARTQEGILPALEAKAGKEHRAKFVDLNDAVEYLLRFKTGDTGYLQGDNIPAGRYDRVASNNPVNPSNALEEWGLRDDQLELLEEVALNSMEFEELIETPAELGLIVPDDVLDAELDRAGYSEQTKDFLRQVNGRIDRSNRVWEEKTAVESVVSGLDSLVKDGELTPSEALAFLPAEADVARDALQDRFENVQTLPPGAASRAQVESSFSRGYTDRQTLEDRLDRLEFDVEQYDGVVKSSILDELDGDLQEAVALGLVSENEFSNLCQHVGLDQAATDSLLAGESLGDITKRRLQDEQEPDELSTSAIQGIGDARSSSLELEGIASLADLAGASPAEVAEIAQVSETTAEGWISQATQATE